MLSVWFMNTHRFSEKKDLSFSLFLSNCKIKGEEPGKPDNEFILINKDIEDSICSPKCTFPNFYLRFL